jgi:hypothetical protein
MTKIIQSAKSRRQKIFGSRISSKNKSSDDVFTKNLNQEGLNQENLNKESSQKPNHGSGEYQNIDQSLNQNVLNRVSEKTSDLVSNSHSDLSRPVVQKTENSESKQKFEHISKTNAENEISEQNKQLQDKDLVVKDGVVKAGARDKKNIRPKPKAIFVEKINTNNRSNLYNNIFEENSEFFAKNVFNRDFAEGKRAVIQNKKPKKLGWLGALIQKMIRKPYKPKTSIQNFGVVKKNFKGSVKIPLENGIYFKNKSGESKFISVEKLILLDFLK